MIKRRVKKIIKITTLLALLSPLKTLALTCSKNEHVVREHIRSKTIHVRSYCRKNPKGYKNWHYYLKLGRPKNWPGKKEKTSKWTNKDTQKFLKALKKLPSLFQNVKIKGIFRLKRSTQHPNSGSNHLGKIILYDNAFKNDEILIKTLTHELAHSIYDALPEAKKRDYLFRLGWTKLSHGQKSVWIGRQKGYVEPDGALNPDEDFCNNLEFYLFEPNKLKNITPLAYDWIKNNLSKELK